MQNLAKETRNASHRRKTIRVLALEREHEGICRDGLRVGSPRDEPWKKPIVPCGEEVDTVRTEEDLHLLKGGGREPNVGVILPPSR